MKDIDRSWLAWNDDDMRDGEVEGVVYMGRLSSKLVFEGIKRV